MIKKTQNNAQCVDTLRNENRLLLWIIIKTVLSDWRDFIAEFANKTCKQSDITIENNEQCILCQRKNECERALEWKNSVVVVLYS